MIGPTPLEGFIVANGSSGHGFKESPPSIEVDGGDEGHRRRPWSRDTDGRMESVSSDRAVPSRSELTEKGQFALRTQRSDAEHAARGKAPSWVGGRGSERLA